MAETDHMKRISDLTSLGYRSRICWWCRGADSARSCASLTKSHQTTESGLQLFRTAGALLAEPSIVAIDHGTCRTEPVQRPSPPVAAGASLELSPHPSTVGAANELHETRLV